MSTAKFNTWQNPDGTENYKCRAWVNFNGTGTVAVTAAGNVTSITDLGIGRYRVNLTTAMSDTLYAVLATSTYNAATGEGQFASQDDRLGTKTTSQIFIGTYTGASYADSPAVYVAILR
jgi:hypothetical protein